MAFLNTRDTYKMLQPFSTLEELNANTKAIRKNFKEELFGTVRKVLDVLQSYAVKYYGVCYLSKSEIAEIVNVSTRTIVRACNKLSELGIIVQYQTKRYRGDRRQSTNAIVFVTQINMHIFLNVIPECHTKETPKNTPEVKDIKDKNTYATPSVPENVEEVQIEKTPYQRFKNFVNYYTSDDKLAFKFYGIFLAQINKHINKPSIDIALKAAKYTFNKLKRDKVNSITGYFNNTLKGLLDKFFEVQMLQVYEIGSEEKIEFVNGENMRGPAWLDW